MSDDTQLIIGPADPIRLRVESLLRGPLADAGFALVDVDYLATGAQGPTLTLYVDRSEGINLDECAQASRLAGALLDVDDPVNPAYKLEVSSPGLERKLRTSDHFSGAVGKAVSIKLGPQADGHRRLRGELIAATAERLTVVDTSGREHEVELADITKATTVFEWGPAPKPGQRGAKARKGADARSTGDTEAEGRVATA